MSVAETPPPPRTLLGKPGPAIILVRPQMAENIGMCARAMANFGLSDLRLVAPRDGWPRKGKMKKGALAASSGAHAILEAAGLFESVEAAVADLNVLWATTAREREQGKRLASPEVAMREAAADIMARRADGEGGPPQPAIRHGVLFGPERTGLASDEIALATAIVTFPVDPAFPSLNLSQSVLLMGYEWFRQARGGVLPFAEPVFSPPATREELIAFFAFLEAELDFAGHFGEAEKRPTMTRNLRNIFHRMQLTSQDIRSLRGALISLVQGRRRKGGDA